MKESRKRLAAVKTGTTFATLLRQEKEAEEETATKVAMKEVERVDSNHMVLTKVSSQQLTLTDESLELMEKFQEAHKQEGAALDIHTSEENKDEPQLELVDEAKNDEKEESSLETTKSVDNEEEEIPDAAKEDDKKDDPTETNQDKGEAKANQLEKETQDPAKQETAKYETETPELGPDGTEDIDGPCFLEIKNIDAEENHVKPQEAKESDKEEPKTPEAREFIQKLKSIEMILKIVCNMKNKHLRSTVPLKWELEHDVTFQWRDRSRMGSRLSQCWTFSRTSPHSSLSNTD